MVFNQIHLFVSLYQNKLTQMYGFVFTYYSLLYINERGGWERGRGRKLRRGPGGGDILKTLIFKFLCTLLVEINQEQTMN